MSGKKRPNTVLVVDDEFGPRQAIRVILQNKYNVLTCDNAREAMDIVCSGAVDVVLLDIRMPEMDGLELLKQMKAADVDIEVALLTGYPSTQSVIKAMEYGAYDYIIKPFDKDKIKEVVQEGITKKNRRKSREKLTSQLLSKAFEEQAPQKAEQQKGQLKDYSSIERQQELAEKIYSSAIETIETLLTKIRNNEDLNPYMKKVEALIDEICRHFQSGNALLHILYKNRQKNKYFLLYHIANLLIVCLFLGLNMGFEKSKLKSLGLASIFCDVGMDSLRRISLLPRKVTEEEYDLIKTHIAKSLKVAERIVSLNTNLEVKQAIQFHHERADGSGYLHGIKSDSIKLYAKIIALADVYEAMTHERSYRSKFQPHQTLIILIRSLKDKFDCAVIKALINSMSIYPIGSKVKLDTKELAEVIDVRANSPLRPVVRILEDASGRPIKEKIIMDLSQENSPSIESAV